MVDLVDTPADVHRTDPTAIISRFTGFICIAGPTGFMGLAGPEVSPCRCLSYVTLGDIRAAHPWGPEQVHPRALLDDCRRRFDDWSRRVLVCDNARGARSQCQN